MPLWGVDVWGGSSVYGGAHHFLYEAPQLYYTCSPYLETNASSYHYIVPC